MLPAPINQHGGMSMPWSAVAWLLLQLRCVGRRVAGFLCLPAAMVSVVAGTVSNSHSGEVAILNSRLGRNPPPGHQMAGRSCFLHRQEPRCKFGASRLTETLCSS